MGKDPNKVRMGRNSRRKGKAWERRIANDMKKIFGQAVRRGWQSRQGDDEADNEGVPFMWIEAKHGKTSAASVTRAMAQATRDCDSRWPVAVCKDQRVIHWRDKRLAVIFVGMWRKHWDLLMEKLASSVSKVGKWDPDVAVPSFNRAQVSGKKPAYARHYVSLAEKLDGEDEIALLDMHQEGSEPMVIIGYEDFLSVLRIWHGSTVVYVGYELRQRLEG